ncbi:hypothetical protein O6H91_04G078900 [Diphasiastrum complanatum]|uniref:Uncharacterized protein n=1 Tax=Diphasiastrum complanatum TaxID=34168 RepID=A0ACC2DYD3_DIPCM|nr:hypothetical protein O6H91_04G078900 [Diphasiastrum complanatum]
MSEVGQRLQQPSCVVSVSDQHSRASSLVARFVRSSEEAEIRGRKKGSVVRVGDADSFSPMYSASFNGELVGLPPALATADSGSLSPTEARVGPTGSGSDSLLSSEVRAGSQRWCFAHGADPSTETDVQNSLDRTMQSRKSFSDSDVGFKLLKKSGWKEGTGLGVFAQGRLDPVQTEMKLDRRGIGAERKVKRNIEGTPNRLHEEKPKTKAQKVLSKKVRKAQIEEERLQEKAFICDFLREFWPENV